MKFEIEEHSTIDKRFGVGNDHIWMYVDYDDVNHEEVEAAVNYLKTIVEKHWDMQQFNEFIKPEREKRWKEDKWLREKYPDMNEYIKQGLYE